MAEGARFPIRVAALTAVMAAGRFIVSAALMLKSAGHSPIITLPAITTTMKPGRLDIAVAVTAATKGDWFLKAVSAITAEGARLPNTVAMITAATNTRRFDADPARRLIPGDHFCASIATAILAPGSKCPPADSLALRLALKNRRHHSPSLARWRHCVCDCGKNAVKFNTRG
jgi:hypothetical protein